MILLIVWDGLRPDAITAENTPFLYRMASRGVFCRNSHAVFPTSTRINSAALATGCYPSRHGLVDNELYIPALDPRGVVSCADWRVLKSLADSEGGRLLDAPTLGEILKDAGRAMVSAGSGSPGTTYLTNPEGTGPVVNWAVAWPEEITGAVEDRCGPFPGSKSTSLERNTFVFSVVQNYLIPQYRPDLLTVWVTEPDHSQHLYGLASPEAEAALKKIDVQLGLLVVALEQSDCGQDLTCFVISDHGFSTVSGTVDPKRELVAAGLKAAEDSGDVVVGPNSIYLNPSSREHLGGVVRFLQKKEWIGALFLRDDMMEDVAGVLPLSSVFNGHRRSAPIMFSYRWSDQPNKNGVPGSALSSTRYHAMHGSASPWAINNSLVAWGRGVKQGVVSEAPCGIVDIAPTVLHLLKIEASSGMDGRVLKELLVGHPSPDEIAVSHETRESEFRAGARGKRQTVHYSLADGRRYLDRVTMRDL